MRVSTALAMPPAPHSPQTAYRTNALVGGDDDAPHPLVEVVAVWGGDEVVMASYLEAGERFLLTAAAGGRHAFAHPAHEGPPRALVEHDEGRCVVHDPALGSFTLPARDAVALRVGDFTFRVRRVGRSERLPRQRRDRLLGVALPVALACTALVGGVTRRVAPSLTTDGRDDARRYLTALLRRSSARAIPPTAPPPDDVPIGGTGHRASGDEGAAGMRTAPRAQRRWQQAPARGPAVDERLVRRSTGAVEPASVQRRGIFAALGQVGFAPGAFPLPGVHEETRATGNLYGTAVGDSFGYASLGLSGTGWGGGAHASDLVGLGRIRTNGHGSDDGTGQGMGGGRGACGCAEWSGAGLATSRAGLETRGARAPTVPAARPEVEGGLAPGEIRRVVLRNLGQVRHCYAQALAVHAGAAGRVTVRWVIGDDGRVLGAGVANDTTGIPSLGDCVAGAVRRWQFPAPSGGVVTVNYPFSLDTAG